jgi:hypothetical protein
MAPLLFTMRCCRLRKCVPTNDHSGTNRTDSEGVVAFSALAILPAADSICQESAPQGTPTIIFNQQIIDGLNSQLQVEDTTAVFRAVFFALAPEAMVYPTENYYYFQIYTGGKTIGGNLRLDAEDRDQGIIHLGYFEYDENGRHQDREGWARSFSARDGAIVTRLGRFLYSVAFAGKTVTFRLNDLTGEKPGKATLRPEEVFVGPVFDESGLSFFLLFNTKTKHFMYTLNEHGYVPEHFANVSDEVLIGVRTAFAFYLDRKNNRKILIGAHGWSVDRNSYYDGPFDQLPDNFIDSAHLGAYIEEAYPAIKGKINRYGEYKNQMGARVLVFPYMVYYDDEELTKIVTDCKASKAIEDEFYACITPDPMTRY